VYFFLFYFFFWEGQENKTQGRLVAMYVLAFVQDIMNVTSRMMNPGGIPCIHQQRGDERNYKRRLKNKNESPFQCVVAPIRLHKFPLHSAL
jgi:hypothetical protein